MKDLILQYRQPLLLLAGLLLLKALVMAGLPLTGDEAYLNQLGFEPRLAYYDHPQLHPWLVSLFSQLSDNYIYLRWVGTLMVLAVAYALYGSGRLLGFERESSLLVAMVYLLGSSNALSVILINDITIHLFLAWGLYAFLRYLRDGHWQTLLASGMLAGAAFLVKYTVAVVVVPMFIVVLLYRRPRIWPFLFWFALGMLPFVALNLYTNYSCCWSNIVFNVFNRAGRASVDNLLVSVLTFVMVVNPVLVYYFIRGARALRGVAQLRVPANTLLTLLLLPFLLLLLIAIKKTIYPAWVINFGFILYLLLLPLPRQQLQRALYASLAYSVLILAGLGYVAGHAQQLNRVARYQPALSPQPFCQQWQQQAPGYLRAATYYDEAAILGYHCGRTMNLFMDNYFGRDDDLAIDYRALDGKDIAILLMDDNLKGARYTPEQMAGYFAHTELRHFQVAGFDYALLLGQGFDYGRYREGFLLPMYRKHYLQPLPKWFPAAASCPLADGP